VAIFLGLLSMGGGALFGLWGCLQLVGLAGGSGLGSSLLLTSVYVLGGCTLCALGIVGEYVGRIYEQVKGRPIYVVRDSSFVRARTQVPVGSTLSHAHAVTVEAGGRIAA
jgi:hypothetical protein